MRPFRSNDSKFNESIAIDASTNSDITVTVAVSTKRSAELDILDSIYEASRGHDFYPFRDKSNNLTGSDCKNLFESVIEANEDWITATTHLGHDNSDTERIEAVQSAVLVDRLNPTGSLTILDGDQNKATRFGRAIGGLTPDCPPVGTCLQAELYYPTSLLADLTASYLSHTITHPRHCSETTPSAPISKVEFSNQWGKAYSSMVNCTDGVPVEQITQRRADTVTGRVQCWFNGFVGGGHTSNANVSIRPVIKHARREGYERVANRLSEI